LPPLAALGGSYEKNYARASGVSYSIVNLSLQIRKNGPAAPARASALKYWHGE
jgi:hypothetical protein